MLSADALLVPPSPTQSSLRAYVLGATIRVRTSDGTGTVRYLTSDGFAGVTLDSEPGRTDEWSLAQLVAVAS